MADEGRQRKQQKVQIGLAQILIGVGVSVIVVLFSFTTLYEIQELKVLDERFKIRNRFFGLPPVDPHVALVEIDDRTLETEGRWQDWTRDKFARLLDALSQYKARVVGFDIFFPEPSAKVVSKEIAVQALDDREQVHREEVFQLFVDYDGIFRQSLERAGNVYLGQTFEVVEEDTIFTGVKPRSPDYDERFKAMASFYHDYPIWEKVLIKRCIDLTAPPLKEHIEAAKGVGFVQTVPDPDGTRRRYQLVMVYDGKLVPSLVVLMLCDYLQVPFSSLDVVPGKYLRFPNAHMPDGRVIHLTVPMDEEGRMYVNWVGGSKEGFSRYPHSLVTAFAETQRYLKVMKEIAHKQPDGFGDPERVVAEMHARGLNHQATIEETYGMVANATAIEGALQVNSRLNAREFFEGVGLAESEIAPEHIEMFETVRANVVVASFLEKEPHLTLEQVTQKSSGIVEPGRIKKDYFTLKKMLENGGITPEDHPLYFSPPITLEGREVLPDEFEGKVYFYGLTATGTHDLNPTPFEAAYPLLGIHANAFNTIVTQNFITRLPWWGNVVILVLLALLMSLVVPLFTALRTGGIMIGVLVIYIVAVFFLFTEAGLWVDIVGPVMTLSLTYLSVTLYGYIRKEREKDFVEGAFGRFLAPSVVEQIVEHPEMLTQLGGEELVLTAFFSDVKGFSTVSQKLTPKELVELLNEYLSAMVEIIEAHGGTIDKFEGDAIIAFYGAPIHYEDHPARACLAALAMQKKLSEMREKWKQEGRQLLYVRMGMNTGPMVVGNMGSQTRVDYTIMGDTVNIAARFEPGCKIYGVYTQIGDKTYEGAKHAIEARELDRLVVVGRSEPVTTYEILSRKGDLDPQKTEIVGLYNRGLELYRNRQWDEAISHFQQALQLDPKDGPSLTYVSRCEEFKITPPPDDWKGTFQQTEK